MAKDFDITLKYLLESFSSDWANWLLPELGLPGTLALKPLNVELSNVQLVADQVYELLPSGTGLLHIEVQSSWDGSLSRRLLLYNALLDERYDQSVFTFVLLLRREAMSGSLTGVHYRTWPNGREYHRFEYRVVKLWELPTELLWRGGIGTLPLALLTDGAEGRLGEMVAELEARLHRQGVAPSVRKLVLTSSYILLGLRYNSQEIREAFRGVDEMKESTTYQAILAEGLEKGLEKGRLEGLRAAILSILRSRFGIVPKSVIADLDQIQDEVVLQAKLVQSMQVPSLAEFE